MESITHKTARTSMWAAIERFSIMGVQFLVSIILARLLCPSDYGTIAMLTIFIEICGTFIECGFGNALIRKQDCTSLDLNTAFYFNVAVAIVMYVVLFICAPLVSDFYNMDILCPLLRWTGLSLIISALSLVQYTLLSKELEARKQANISIISSVASAVIGISMAYAGCGVWSLVGQTLGSNLIRLLLLWIKSRWYPAMEYSRESMRYLWNFGSKMLVTGLISTTYRNIYSIIIGKAYTSSVLGLFNRGQSLAQLIPNLIESVLVKNSLPILSQIQNDKEHLVHVYREYIKLGCFLTFPSAFLIAALAKPFVLFVLTDKWMGCVIYIQIFAFATLLSAANSINLNLLQVYGRSDYTLKAEVIKKSAGFITILCMLTQGPLALAVISGIIGYFGCYINLYYAKKLSGLRYSTQIMDIMPILICSLLMYAIVYASIYFIHNSLVQLIVGGFVGVASFLLIAKYLFRMKQFDYLKKLKK